MYIKNNKSKLFFSMDRNITGTPLLFIHGFTGSSHSWDFVKDDIECSKMSVDIPGHGRSTFNSLSDDYTYNDFTTELYLSLKQMNINKLTICGYSMGGRLAITFAAKYPHLIHSLILESSSLGLHDSVDRRDRMISDKDLSETISQSYHSFIDNWENNPLFSNQESRNPQEYIHQKKIRSSHEPNQLSKSLLSFSAGNMSWLGSSFQEFNFPISIINGKDDNKYIKEGRQMLLLNKKCKQFIINNASHNTHLENPDEFIYALNNYIIDELVKVSL